MSFSWLNHSKWMDDAKCKDAPTYIFFDDNDDGVFHHIKEAQQYCDNCPVRSECLSFAMSEHMFGDETGIYGGLVPRQRRTLARKKRRERSVRREAECEFT